MNTCLRESSLAFSFNVTSEGLELYTGYGDACTTTDPTVSYITYLFPFYVCQLAASMERVSQMFLPSVNATYQVPQDISFNTTFILLSPAQSLNYALVLTTVLLRAPSFSLGGPSQVTPVNREHQIPSSIGCTMALVTLQAIRTRHLNAVMKTQVSTNSTWVKDAINRTASKPSAKFVPRRREIKRRFIAPQHLYRLLLPQLHPLKNLPPQLSRQQKNQLLNPISSLAQPLLQILLFSLL